MADEKTRSGGGAAQGVAKAGANRTDRTDRADRTGRADQADQADQASDCPCRHKSTPRSMELQADMQKRLNRAIGQLTGVKAMIIDASDIDCVILGKCRDVTLTDEQLCEIVRDNPAGQEGQCTPFILIRKKA